MFTLGAPHRGAPLEKVVNAASHRHVGAASHFDLLNHPAIYDQIRRWLSGRPALAAPLGQAV